MALLDAHSRSTTTTGCSGPHCFLFKVGRRVDDEESNGPTSRMPWSEQLGAPFVKECEITGEKGARKQSAEKQREGV